MHKSLDEFKFKPDQTTDYGVTCPWASEKSMYNVVNTLAPSFLIGSSSFMQVLRTTIQSCISSKFGQIRLWTRSKLPLSVGKNPHRLTMGEMS